MSDIPDDLSTTVTLRPDSPVSSDIGVSDVDVVRVDLTAGQTYVFDMTGAASDRSLSLLDPEIVLLDENGNPLAYDDDSGPGLDASIRYMAARSGTFYLAAGGVDGTGTYRLSMATAAGMADDFGQSPAAAGLLSLGASQAGRIGAGLDQDWFGVVLSAGQTYQFSLRASSASLDPVLAVYDANGTLVGGNDDENNATLNALLLFTPTATGTYYLGASGYDASTGDYVIAASATAPDLPDTAATTAHLLLNGTLASTIETPDDADAIRVDLVAGRTYVIDVAGADAGTGLTLRDPFVVLVDSSFNPLATDDDSGTGLNASVRYTPSVTGTYFIGALSSDGGVGTYSVTLRSPTGPLPETVRDDFDGSGASDILWQNVDGSISSWSVTGGRIGYNSFFASVAASWNVVETFDMDGDGRSDILWRNTDGAVAAWRANGAQNTQFDQGGYLASSPGDSWKIVATGDINGDGRDDIFWRNDDGSVSAWNSTGTGFQQNSYYHASVGQDWKVVGLADFNGDGKDDLLWRNDNGAISEWLSTGDGFQENSLYDASVPPSWHIRGLADLNGDGQDDIIWRNDDGALSTWLSAGNDFVRNAYFTASVGTDWQIAQTGDYDGDGRADLLWRNVGGAISAWRSNGTGFDQNVLFDSGPGGSWQIQAHEFIL